jgi:hypothetical protein
MLLESTAATRRAPGRPRKTGPGNCYASGSSSSLSSSSSSSPSSSSPLICVLLQDQPPGEGRVLLPQVACGRVV